ncbi:unnamed protein product [Paramecium octaurelia]|uniref:Tetratricopeptide repeat protein n=1 Tax=Paramecium octaurelia TaxID=43137 RepID=A0A8S1XQL5_PAROT|nr:unnamed protein product [Paramecium octaurelia]
MEIFKCRYVNHENEEIIGFCLNQNCKKATQYCYLCLTQTHSDHQNDCIRFVTMNQHINQFIQVQKQSNSQIKGIIIQMKNCFEQIQKLMDQEINTLENMNQKLLNKDYLTFKSEIKIIKQFYSKEKEIQIQKQIIEFNQILNTIKNMVSIQQKINDKSNIGQVKKISIEEQKNQKIKEAKELFKKGQELATNGQFNEAIKILNNSIQQFDQDDEVYLWKGFALDSLNQYEDAIECYDKAISLNPNDYNTCYNKGFALSNLNKYEEAIECYDKAISLNPNDDNIWNNKGSALSNLNKYKEALVCYDNAISLNSNNSYLFSNKGFALHQLKQYQKALLFYDKSLSILVTPLTLKLKADSLFELGLKSQAKKFYLTALEQGSTETQYIKKQLSQL